VQPADLEAHLFSEVCVEVAEGLVEQQDLARRPGVRPGDPLLLAAEPPG
jgi:hypothetical protein